MKSKNANIPGAVRFFCDDRDMFIKPISQNHEEISSLS